MARKRVEVIDDDGNEIPMPTADHPVMAIVWLMEYGRKRGFKIGPAVKVGDCVVQVRDLRQENSVAAMASDDRGAELDPDSDMAIVLGASD